MNNGNPFSVECQRSVAQQECLQIGIFPMGLRLVVCAAFAAAAAGPGFCQDIPKPSACLSAALKLPLYFEKQSQAQPGSELEKVASFMVRTLEVQRFRCRQLGWWVELQVTNENREQMWSMATALAAEGL